jgi:hypothetical protein
MQYYFNINLFTIMIKLLSGKSFLFEINVVVSRLNFFVASFQFPF